MKRSFSLKKNIEKRTFVSLRNSREVDNFTEKLIKNFNISIPHLQEFEDKYVEEFEGRKLIKEAKIPRRR